MNGYWRDNEIHIGSFPERSEKKFYFEAFDGIPPIKNIIPGCGCSDFRYDKNTGRLHIVYQADRIPYHLRDQGNQEITKHFKIEYTDGGSENLTFHGIKTAT